YRRDIIPGQSKPYALQLPAAYAYGFVQLEDSIALYRAGELFANRTKSISNQEKVKHKVKPGETMLAIADQYGVTSTQIRRWNGMKSSRVSSGRVLTIYVDNGGYALNNSTAAKTATTTKQSGNKKVAAADSNTKTKSSGNGSYITYKVQSGDSFYTIAKNYPGVSAKDIMEFNNVSSSSLRIGQTIKIPRDV
ncbi:MAG: LysM peptidoglycan-binding domain-containing protein, partial [Dysgonamonadaceae bacterium]|nr:LysM peptidoglycan-binding domain-containing protein [Dysgonamonadaceae bacterium]